MNTPILFLIFNRPDTTQRVFDAIKRQRPQYLFVAADGPRPDKEGEFEKCQITRDIIKQIDWDCEIKTLFREKNIGCKRAVSEAITWFFDHVEEGIILEDDCLPHPSFIMYCQELLSKFRNDERVGLISGANLWGGFEGKEISYSFSKHASVWGWATWRRCWNKYKDIYDRVEQKDPTLKKIKSKVSSNRSHCNAFWSCAKAVMNGLDTWDYQWCMTIYENNFLVIRPKVNMIANIGFGSDATHTTGKAPPEYLTTHEMKFPLKHPQEICQDLHADKLLEDVWLCGGLVSLYRRAFAKSKRLMHNALTMLKIKEDNP